MASRPHRRRTDRITPAAAGSVLCVILLAVTGYVALAGSHVRALDATVLRGFRSLDVSGADRPLSGIAHLVDPVPYLIAGIVLVVVALRRGRRDHAIVVTVLLLGSGATSQALKHALAQPRLVNWLGADQIGDASWPSGHATAVMALALSAVLVSRAGHRRWAALAGGALAAAVATAVLALAWHFPSDVLGGFLVAATWALGLVAALELREPARRIVTWRELRTPLALAAGAGLLCVLGAALALALRDAGAARSLAALAKLAGALVIAAVACALPLALSRAVDR